MIERAPFGATGHESSRVIFGAAALGDVSKADADRTLEVLLEHGINHIDVAASYGDAELRIANWLNGDHEFFVATKTGEREYAPRPRGDPAVAGPARGRPRRLDPAAQPVRRDRVGHRAQPRRRAGGLPGGARRGSGALHRRHRPRAEHPEDAPAQPRSLRLRHRPVPVQLGPDAGPALRRDLRRPRGAVPGARRRAADDQEPRLQAVGRTRARRRRPGTSRSRTRPRSTWR